MAYPQSLLSDGEKIQFELRPHFRALFVPIVVLLAIVFIGTFLLVKFWDSSVGDLHIMRWVILFLYVLILIWFVLVPFLRWLTTQYVFTNRRIITRRGVITKQGRDMPLSKVNNVSFDIPVMGRILNYGALKIDSANTEGDLVIMDVPNVENIQREVYRLHEEDDARRRSRSDELGGDPVPPTDGT